MKANELIIGGLFYEKKGTQKRIVRITAIESVTRIVRGIYVDDGEDTGWFIVDILQPIPLTEEILKANGLEKKSEVKQNREYRLRNDSYIIEVYLFDKGNVYYVEHNYSTKEKYRCDSVHKCGFFVHELQYALRLCGLNDIADNFKL